MMDLRMLPRRDALMSRLKSEPGSKIKEVLYLSCSPVVSLAILENGLYILNAESTSIMFDKTMERCYLLECDGYDGPLPPPFITTEPSGFVSLHFSFVSLETRCIEVSSIPVLFFQ
jgi:hypothetical protein